MLSNSSRLAEGLYAFLVIKLFDCAWGEALLPPFVLIDVGGFVVLFFVAVSVLLRARSGAVVFPRFRRGFFRTLAPVLFNDAATSRPWKTCSRAKWVAHIFLFWGFLLLGAATTLAFFMKPEGAVLSLNHPVKILGILAVPWF